ncbi:MAG: hypothetical protein QF738_05510 [Rhodospirillales bacterium]|jgi:hypothetical protein|nr:hypothetical protein [Rhodospirillales bacterium]
MRILSVAILAALFAIVSSGGAAWAEDYRGVDVHVTNRGIESVAEMRLYVYKCNHFSEQVHIPQGEDAEVHIAVCPAVAGEMVLVIVEGFIEYADRWAGFTGSRACPPSGPKGGSAQVGITLHEVSGRELRVRCTE